MRATNPKEADEKAAAIINQSWLDAGHTQDELDQSDRVADLLDRLVASGHSVDSVLNKWKGKTAGEILAIYCEDERYGSCSVGARLACEGWVEDVRETSYRESRLRTPATFLFATPRQHSAVLLASRKGNPKPTPNSAIKSIGGSTLQPIKVCPRCSTPSALDAPICTSCGHQFRTRFNTIQQTQALPTVPPHAVPTVVGTYMRRAKVYAPILFVIIAVAIIICGDLALRKYRDAQLTTAVIGEWGEGLYKQPDGRITVGGEWIFNADGTANNRYGDIWHRAWRIENGIMYLRDSPQNSPEIGLLCHTSSDGTSLVIGQTILYNPRLDQSVNVNAAQSASSSLNLGRPGESGPGEGLPGE